jgi:hypothetical protein
VIALQKTLQAILDYKLPEPGPGPATSAKVKVKEPRRSEERKVERGWS